MLTSIKVFLSILLIEIFIVILTSGVVKGISFVSTSSIGNPFDKPGVWNVLTFAGDAFWNLMTFNVTGAPLLISGLMWFFVVCQVACLVWLIRGAD